MFPNVLNEWLLMFCMLNKKKIYPAYVSKHDSNCKKQVVLLMTPNAEGREAKPKGREWYSLTTIKNYQHY